MSNIDTSSWQEFRIGDLFSIETPKKKLNAYEVEFGGSHPYVVRTASDNGIRGYINADEAWLNDAGTIAFGQDTGTIFYQPEPYFTGDKIKIMRLQDAELTESIALYLIAAMKRGFAGFSWGQSSFNVSVLENVKISLPAKVVDEPDWAYMEEYIKQLEAERIAELEAYLIAAGLDDCELTDEDKQALSQPQAMAEFRVGDLFKLINNPQLDKRFFRFTPKAGYSYFTRTENNNGILGYVEYLDDEHKISGHSLAVGMISMRFHYMPHDFYAGQFTKTLIPRFSGFNEHVAMYFIAELNARSSYYQGFLVREFADKVLNTSLMLPANEDGSPDYDHMAAYIRAQQKLAIADVVRMKDRIIEETKAVVER